MQGHLRDISDSRLSPTLSSNATRPASYLVTCVTPEALSPRPSTMSLFIKSSRLVRPPLVDSPQLSDLLSPRSSPLVLPGCRVSRCSATRIQRSIAPSAPLRNSHPASLIHSVSSHGSRHQNARGRLPAYLSTSPLRLVFHAALPRLSPQFLSPYADDGVLSRSERRDDPPAPQRLQLLHRHRPRRQLRRRRLFVFHRPIVLHAVGACSVERPSVPFVRGEPSPLLPI